MGLINVDTLQLQEFVEPPPYAILSHTWGPEEVTFQDMFSSKREGMRGWAKILGSYRQAILDDFQYAWVDTFCIDKTSSSELSEAINSMFTWYQNSAVCYAYLEDVPPVTDEKFKSARWFTRGWCLQELITPASVEFYTQYWTFFGTKALLSAIVTEITSIPEDA